MVTIFILGFQSVFALIDLLRFKKHYIDILKTLLLLLLSYLSRVWPCATPQTAAHQVPPSLGFSKQERWNRLLFPSLMHEREVKSLSCVWLLATPWTVPRQAPPSMGFSRQQYWSGLPFPTSSIFIYPSVHPFLHFLFSCSVMSDSLWPHGLQHSRLPCPSLSPGVCSNSCPLNWWCHPTMSSSVILFSSCLQSFWAAGSF